MHTQQLFAGLKILQLVNNLPQDVGMLYSNSQEVKANGVFVCIRGTKCDGHNFAKDAVNNGATVVVCERLCDVDVCQVVVEDTHKAMSVLSSNFFGNPANQLKTIAVVGTNGKTSTAVITSKILSFCGYKVGLISTNGIYIDGNYYANDMTTPNPFELNKLWRQMADNDVEFCVFEMSAHAIHQQKTFGNVIDLVVFTNFSQDHLDYFGDIASYKNTKTSFFDKQYAKIAVINCDDSVGKEILLKDNLPTVSYGIDNPADVFAVDVCCLGDKSCYVVNMYDEICTFKYNLSGMFNVYNTMASATACRVFGIKPNKIAQALARIGCIEGRNQSINLPNGAKAVVDFAHTPDGLKNILSHLKNNTFGKLITIFGCGGDRDKTKRKLMGEVASQYSDYVLLTSDNPRGEDPFEIMFEAEKGVSVGHKLVCDRKSAITEAIKMSNKNDVIAILGKGHEKTQEINGVKYPFSDVDVVLDIIKTDVL